MALFGSNIITGVDIGAGSIKIVRIAPGRKPRLLAAGIVEFPLDKTGAPGVSTDLRFLFSGKKFRSRHVVTLLPGKYLTVRALTMPKMPPAELAEAVRWESKRHISYPLDAALVEYLVTGFRREGLVEKCDVLLVAAERKAAVAFLTPFQEAGVAVSTVDANPLALRNGLRLRRKGERKNVLLIDMGAGKTEIDIYQGDALRFSRCLETGGLAMTRAVSEQLGIEVHEAEAKKQKVNILAPPEQNPVIAAARSVLDGVLVEVRRSIEYYKPTFREQTIDRTILTGGVALMAGIKDYVSRALALPVELDSPFEGLAVGRNVVSQDIRALSPRFSAAVGLALRKG
jgi:type IV pilus assembly protein PilM